MPEPSAIPPLSAGFLGRGVRATAEFTLRHVAPGVPSVNPLQNVGPWLDWRGETVCIDAQVPRGDGFRHLWHRTDDEIAAFATKYGYLSSQLPPVRLESVMEWRAASTRFDVAWLLCEEIMQLRLAMQSGGRADATKVAERLWGRFRHAERLGGSTRYDFHGRDGHKIVVYVEIDGDPTRPGQTLRVAEEALRHTIGGNLGSAISAVVTRARGLRYEPATVEADVYLQLAARLLGAVYESQCEYCGQTFFSRRPKKFCTPNHKSQDYQRRRRFGLVGAGR